MSDLGAGNSVRIVTKYERYDCGMCGPSSRQVSTVTITQWSAPVFENTWRQALCDNSDPLTEEVLLRFALEALGFEVMIENRDGDAPYHVD